ncbi:MAG: hypothetical protein WD646_07425 [Actinomycetota bacterium]
MPDFRLDSGIGRAIASALTEHGARVAIAARNDERKGMAVWARITHSTAGGGCST